MAMVEHDSEFGFRHPLPRLTVRLEGELDLSRIDELDCALTPASSPYGGELTVDLTGVTFVDSTVVRWLLGAQEMLRPRNGRLRVVATPDGSLVRILALTGLQDQIEVDLSPPQFPGKHRPATSSV